MGRSLLLACTAALVMTTLTTASMRRTAGARDARVTDYEADVLAREAALSALNQAVPFVASRFDSLVSGQTVDTRPLVGTGRTPAVDVYGGLVRPQAASPRLRLSVGAAPQTLLPTRELSTGTLQHASVRVLAGGKVELVAEGVQVVSGPDGSYRPVTYQMRRVYAKSSPLDAALIAIAPAIAPTFSGGFRIDGRDTDASTLLPTGQTARDRHGIKTNTPAVAARIGAVVGTAQQHRIMGVNGAGDIVTGATQADLSALFEEAFAHPRRTVLAAASVGTASYGSASGPAVVVRNGDLTLQGTLSGTGVLVVNGNLTTTGPGKLVWDGLVIVRKDGSTPAASPVLTAELGNGSRVTGSFVVMQGASAFVMPFRGRVQVNYLGSWDAGLHSSVGIEHARDGQIVQQRLVAPGANRTGDVTQTYTADLQAGEQVNFFIGVHYPSWFSNRLLAGTEAYKNYARGHFDPASGRPYGITQQTGPFEWRMAFEDLRVGVDIGFGSRPDWDYDRPGREDQVIQVTLQCRAYRDGALHTVGGVQQYEACTPDHPDTREQDVRLDWAGLTSGSGTVVAPTSGAVLQLGVNDATLVHSSASIGRLTPLLRTLREASEVVLVDAWASR